MILNRIRLHFMALVRTNDNITGSAPSAKSISFAGRVQKDRDGERQSILKRGVMKLLIGRNDVFGFLPYQRILNKSLVKMCSIACNVGTPCAIKRRKMTGKIKLSEVISILYFLTKTVLLHLLHLLKSVNMIVMTVLMVIATKNAALQSVIVTLAL